MRKADQARLDRMNTAYHEWAQSPGGQRYGNDPWAAFQAGYLTAIDQEPYPANKIPMPQNADQAVGMWLTGESWVRHNAPERLRPSPTSPGAQEDRSDG